MIGNYKEICSDVESIIMYSQEYPFDINVAPLMEDWYKAKKYIIKNYFQGNTSVELNQKIVISLSKEQQEMEFAKCLQTLEDYLILTEDLEKFLKANRKGFFNNQVVEGYPSLNIKEGSKLSKSFKKFIDDRDDLRQAQDIVSSFIQENKIEGYLRFSVDPRDFLTLSENKENWRSCQSLDGDYRAGCLSYMLDYNTIIVYLSDKEKKHFKCLPPKMKLPSKKWRMLIHIGKNCIYFDKQYPYSSEGLLSMTQTTLTDIFHLDVDPAENFGYRILFNNVSQNFTEFNQLYAGGRVFDTRDIIDDNDYLGYCDLTCSPTYTPITAVKSKPFDKYRELIMKPIGLTKEYKEFKKVFGIKVGAKVPCICCGKEYVEKQNSFLCPTCIVEKKAHGDFFLICSNCESKIYDEDEIFWEDDMPYCKKCYQELQREIEITLSEDDESV